MSAKEMATLIGKIGDMPVGDLRFVVKVTDVRESWGKINVLVEPVKGDGRAWKALDSLINLRKGK